MEIETGPRCVFKGLTESDADDCAYAHHGVGEQVFSFLENGFAQAGGTAVDPEFDDSATRVTLFFASE